MTGVQTCALRSEEHTSELQSHDNLVCRLLLEKKKIHDAIPEDAAQELPPATTHPPRAPEAPVHVVPPDERAERFDGGVVFTLGVFFFKDPAPPERDEVPHQSDVSI